VVRAALPRDIETLERGLLAESVARKPGLPVGEIDVLVVDEMGKDVSGVGLDTAVIGRMRVPGVEEPRSPVIGIIVVTDLTEASHGNALGVGLADIVTRRLQRKIDAGATYENAATSTSSERAKVPGGRDGSSGTRRSPCDAPAAEDAEPRVIGIRNTLRLMSFVSRLRSPRCGSRPVVGLGDLRDQLDPRAHSCPSTDE
jgi:hypothetical protein